MQIAGKEIDLQKIIDSAVNKTREEEKYRMEAPDDAREHINACIESHVWAGILGKIGGQTDSGSPINAEAAVAELIHSGVEKDRIRYHNDTYKVRLENMVFRIKRQENGFRVGPRGGICLVKGLDAKEFADFIFKFDSIIPQLQSAGDVIYQEILNEYEESRKREMARQVAFTTVESILKEFIKPLGISYRTEIHGGKVTVHLTQTKKATYELPISELAEKMKDTAAVLNSLKVVPPEDEVKSLL